MPVTDAENTFWVHIRIDGGELTPRGPFRDSDEAEAMAARLGAICRGVLRQPVHVDIRRTAADPVQGNERKKESSVMGDIVDLQGKPVTTRDDIEFISDMARFSELILTEKAIRKKYRLADDVWKALGDDDNLVRAIEAESVRRIRDGSCKREKSQLLITKASAILDGLMSDASASPRHRIDAIRTLDGFAANGPAGAPVADRFQITINLGADTVRFDRSIEINPNDRDPNDPTPSQVVFPVIAAKDEQW